jgi:hypothetical protein
MVIAHEQAHLAGYDPQLLTLALCLVVLMPWNLPLWWQLHRLRYGIEVDCDARVLKSGLDTRQYGEMLLEVSQRPSVYVGAVAAMSESRSFLEDRITLMVRNPAKWGSIATVVFGSLAITLVALAAQVTPPNVGSSDAGSPAVALTSEFLDRHAGFYLRGSNIVVLITREGDHLFWHFPDLPPVELFADAEMIFTSHHPPGFKISFIHDESGQATGLLMYFDWPGNPFTVSWARIDSATAQTIKANNELRARSQTPVPGSDAALKRLIDGILAGKPNYDEMTPWYAGLLRQGWPITNSIYAKRGAVRSLEFRLVNRDGGDVYEVRQEGGVSYWIIYLDSNGLIEDADDSTGGP